MAEKQFIDFLDDSFEDRIRCIFETRRGQVIGINVVQFETLLSGEWIPVLRYDTAHGFFHRDVFLSRGKKRLKEFIFHVRLEESLTFAIDDIRKNWKHYITSYAKQTQNIPRHVRCLSAP